MPSDFRILHMFVIREDKPQSFMCNTNSIQLDELPKAVGFGLKKYIYNACPGSVSFLSRWVWTENRCQSLYN